MPLLTLLLSLLVLPARAQVAAPAVTGQGIGVSSAAFSWNLVSGATAYDVISSTFGDLSGILSSATLTFATPPEFSTNSPVAVYVEAFGGGTISTSALTTAYTLAAQPNGSQLLYQGAQPNIITMAWNAQGNPAGTKYDVDWWIAGSTPTVFSTTSVAGASVTATISDLSSGVSLLFAVQAENGDGAKTPFDLFLSTYIPPIFGQVAMSSGSFALGVSSIDWSWSASTGVVNYQVFSDTGGPVSPLLPNTQTSFTETGLSTNTAYTDYVRSYGVSNSTDSTPFTQWTLANPTSGLALVSLATATETGTLSWSANTNPAGTTYLVEWWSAVSSTITVSTQTTSAVLSPLAAGNTIYFTVQAENGFTPPIVSTFDATYFTTVPSTYFPVGITAVPANNSALLNFLLPTAEVSVGLSSYTFSLPINVTAQAVPLCSSGCLAPPLSGNMQALSGSNGEKFDMAITAKDNAGNVVEPSRPVSIAMVYLGGSLSAAPGAVSIVRYDDNHQAWVPLATQKIGNTLSALTDHLSVFSVAQVTPATGLSSITVGPNPLRPLVNPGQVMTFRNLPQNARLRIFTYVGEKIFDSTADASGAVAWDGRNIGGQMVASGVYIVLIDGTGGKRTLRVAIER